MARVIAYLTSVYARAGDTFIRREVEELRRLGWTVHTFSIRRADESEQVSEEILREQSTTDYILERGAWRLLLSLARTALRSPRRLFRAVQQARRVRAPGIRSWLWHIFYLGEAAYLGERLEALGVSLLHDHISMSSATVAMLASTLAGVPFSMTVHGPHDFMEARHWALAEKISASSLTVVISEFGKSQCMLFAHPREWHKLAVVRCGLDDVAHVAPKASQNSSRLVCVGRLSPEKGQVLLVEAVALLAPAGIRAEIVFVGDGPARQEIEQRAAALGVSDRVRLVGWQSSAEVREWISGSLALVLPSFAEGIPVVLMEAMALKRPVVSTYVGGIPELVRDGESGWLVPAGSAEALASAIRELLAAPAERLEGMGECGRLRVLEQHDSTTEVRKLDALFRRILGAGAS